MLKELFPSWFDVQRYEKVIKFTVGLMSDPTPLVGHIYEISIEWALDLMRTVQWNLESVFMLQRMRKDIFDTGLFTSMYRESKIQLPGYPLHNQYLNYYDHGEDDYKKRPRDTTRMYTPCRFYLFNNVKQLITCDEHREEPDEIPDCVVWAQKSAASVTTNVLLTIRNISQQQKIANLFLWDVKYQRILTLLCCVDVMETDIFNMSKSAKTLDVRYFDLPPNVTEHLLQQLNHCKHLTKLNLSGNTLKGVPRDVCASLLSALSCKHLKSLDLRENSLTGCLSNYKPQPALEELDLSNTGLNNDDIQHLINLIRDRKVPQLKQLVLIDYYSHNKWGLSLNDFRLACGSDVKEQSERLIEACVTHHQRELKLKLGSIEVFHQFDKRMKRRCKGTNVVLNFHSLANITINRIQLFTSILMFIFGMTCYLYLSVTGNYDHSVVIWCVSSVLLFCLYLIMLHIQLRM